MSAVLTDLEEGEIVEDPVPKLCSKELPRRYKLDEYTRVRNRQTSKYKKSIRNSKEVSEAIKLKIKHKHRKSCPRRSKDSFNLQLTQNTQSFSIYPVRLQSIHSSNEYSRSSFKNYTISPKKLNIKNCNRNNENYSGSHEYPELLEEYRKVRNLKSQRQCNFVTTLQDDTKKNINNDYAREESNTTVLQKVPQVCISRIPNENLNESEDEEELRRIALKTCVHSVNGQNPSTDKSEKMCNTIMPTMEKDIEICSDSPIDNYEVIDMEVENEDNVEDKSSELFFIDKNPELVASSNEFISSGEQTTPDEMNQKLHCQVEEDFDADVLRAELIASMYARRDKAENHDIADKTQSEISAVKDLDMPLKTSCNSRQALAILKPNNKKIPKTLKFINGRKTMPSTNTPQERLIISLNSDSSSDESDPDDKSCGKDTTSTANNAVASIEAFISNARKKAEFVDAEGHSNNVSCLSKAQQEEYNALKKIIANKTKRIIRPGKSMRKNYSENAYQSLLSNKMGVVKEKLQKESNLITAVEKELSLKKQAYLRSKLKSHHLRRLLAVSERVRIVNLQAWHKCDSKLKMLKKSFEKQEEILSLLLMQNKNIVT